MTDKESLRREIERLDRAVLDLLNQRLAVAKDIGKIKIRDGQRIPDLKKEAEILANLARINSGPLSQTALTSIFREIVSAAREIQQPPSVAFLGPEATFSHMAALKKFGRCVQFVPLTTISEVFLEMEKGKLDFGVVPVENSSEGVVCDTMDLLVTMPMGVCGEIILPVSHDLLSRSGQRSDIEVIYTHAQAFRQCNRWLSNHLPDIPVVEVASTGLAARKAAQNPNSAAIAGEATASLYDLHAVERRIEDTPGNSTHFFCIGFDAPGPTGADKTSIIFAVQDASGALYRTLRPLEEHGINMTRIVSRPAKRRDCRYLFFVDLDGHHQDEKVAGALEELEGLSSWFKLLGSFPREKISG